LRAANRRWKDRHGAEYRERHNQKQQERYRANPEKYRQLAKKYRLALPLEERQRRARQNKLITKYGIRPEWYEEKLKEQGNACAICREPFISNGQRRVAEIDHKKGTKKVRGLLCHSCNWAIYKIDQDPAWAQRAMAYLRAFA